MKIVLAKYYRQNFIFNFCLFLFCVIGTIILYFAWRDDPEVYIIVLFGLFDSFVVAFILVKSLRFLTYAIVEPEKIQSYSFLGKPLCIVKSDKPIYYSIFMAPQGCFEKKKFIAVSNEPFACKENMYNFRIKRFLAKYDPKKIVVLPYKEVPKDYLVFSQWIMVD